MSTGLLATGAVAVHAHGFRVGAIEIEHPYATPTPPGARTAAVYFRALQNRGERADRLVAASAPIAQGVEIHRGAIDAQGVMRMRAIDSIELPAGAKVRVPRGGPVHLMLTGLRSPLADGDRFPITLRFEHAGEREVTVWVQRPRSSEREHRH